MKLGYVFIELIASYYYAQYKKKNSATTTKTEIEKKIHSWILES